VKLANEYHLPKLVVDIGRPTGYIRHARRATGALREGGYRGLVNLAAPRNRKPRGGGALEAVRAWNERLVAADTSDFDAVILHHYYPSLETTNLDIVYKESLTELAADVEELRALFPLKQLWITE